MDEFKRTTQSKIISLIIVSISIFISIRLMIYSSKYVGVFIYLFWVGFMYLCGLAVNIIATTTTGKILLSKDGMIFKTLNVAEDVIRWEDIKKLVIEIRNSKEDCLIIKFSDGRHPEHIPSDFENFDKLKEAILLNIDNAIVERREIK